MRMFGLTGKKASGKSSVAKIFRQNSIPIIDVDFVYEDIFKPGYNAHKEIIKHFGCDFLDNRGNVNLGKLSIELCKENWIKDWIDELMEEEMDCFMEKVKDAFEWHRIDIVGIESGVIAFEKMKQYVDKIVYVNANDYVRECRMKYLGEETLAMVEYIENRQDVIDYDFIIDNNGDVEELWDKTISVAKGLLFSLNNVE